MYSHLIFEDTGMNRNRSEQEKLEISSKHQKLCEYIRKSGLYIQSTLDGYFRYQQCMADNDSAVVINPEGNLGKCEHFSESEFFGSVFSEKKDMAIINRFKEK